MGAERNRCALCHVVLECFVIVSLAALEAQYFVIILRCLALALVGADAVVARFALLLGGGVTVRAHQWFGE